MKIVPRKRKERPRCRRAIESLIVKCRVSLEDIINPLGPVFTSQGIRIQAHKMLAEKKT